MVKKEKDQVDIPKKPPNLSLQLIIKRNIEDKGNER